MGVAEKPWENWDLDGENIGLIWFNNAKYKKP
jgi:hypothetical protein